MELPGSSGIIPENEKPKTADLPAVYRTEKRINSQAVITDYIGRIITSFDK